MSRSVLTSTCISILGCFLIQSVVGYENAYDLLERRNQRFYEPRYFQSNIFYDDRNSFYKQSRKPHSGYLNSYFSKFGNGYDNLGNGIPVGHFHPFRQQMSGSWPFGRRPFRERTIPNFDFERHPVLDRPRYDFPNHNPGGHYLPTVPHSRPPIENGFYSHGNTDFSKVDRLIEDNEGKKEKKTNEFYQKSSEGVNMDSLKREKAGERLHSDQIGENKSSLRSNKVVKKGRTTKGFAVHHHKDETGNSTTFFDESSDFGGQSDLRDVADGFGTRRTLEQITHKGDEKYFKEDEDRTGNYGSGLLVGNQRFEKDFSSMGGLDESEKKYQTGNENDDLVLTKTYQYLNGDRFDYAEPHVDNHY